VPGSCATSGIEELRLPCSPAAIRLLRERGDGGACPTAAWSGAALYPIWRGHPPIGPSVVATSGRLEPEALCRWASTDLLPWLQAGVASGERPPCVRGREDERPQKTMIFAPGGRIPADPPPIRLPCDEPVAHAVAVILQSCATAGPPAPKQSAEAKPSRAALESRPGRCPKRLLLEVGFLLPHTAQRPAMAKRGRCCSGPRWGSDEVALLRGMVSQFCAGPAAPDALTSCQSLLEF